MQDEGGLRNRKRFPDKKRECDQYLGFSGELRINRQSGCKIPIPS